LAEDWQDQVRKPSKPHQNTLKLGSKKVILWLKLSASRMEDLSRATIEGRICRSAKFPGGDWLEFAREQKRNEPNQLSNIIRHSAQH